MFRFSLVLIVSLVSARVFANSVYLSELESANFVEDDNFSELVGPERNVLDGYLESVSRLRTPKPEVPASVTLITADQIDAWGVRTVPELMRFVPGMFVGHGDDENATSVAYHASSPNVMRRLQVLIDGRSVFQSGVAAVVWNDIPVALEDIERIEVTRGPNSAAYGANSFLGVINITTKHPRDTIGTRLMYRNGDRGIDDGFVSHSWFNDEADYRVSAMVNADSGFDGRPQIDGINQNDGKDRLRDSHRHGSIVLTRESELSGHWTGWNLGLQAGLTRGHTDMRKDSFDQSNPDKDTESGYVWSLLKNKVNGDHEYQIRTYWQYDKKKQGSNVCGTTFVFDPNLFDLYRIDSDLVNIFAMEITPGVASNEDYADLVASVASGSISADVLSQLLNDAEDSTDYDVTEEEYELLQDALIHSFNGEDFSNLTEVACGYSDRAKDEDRIDVEFQDTRRWSTQLRTVAGINFRRDQVKSYTLFQGKVNNDTYRAFGNAEWKPVGWALFNLGGTYETEDANDATFSPRASINFLLTPQQSIRLVYSEAVRSPDLLEQNPNYSLLVTSLSENYLDLESGIFYMNQWPESRNPDHEKIVSREVGYFGQFLNPSVEFDLKIYNDHLSDLISDPINISSTRLNSDTTMNVKGVEFQLSWMLTPDNTLRVNAARIDADVRVQNDGTLTEEEVASKELVETRLSAEDSIVVNWTHRGKGWSFSYSHFWYDSLNSYFYRRYETYVKSSFSMGSVKPWIGLFWQHQISREPLVYLNQGYSSEDSICAELGFHF